jgi:DNA invertase Pin-like site-specific DNA recombinase
MPDVPQPKKMAALYGRVSTDEQVEGFSPETQERLCRELAALEGYAIHPEGFLFGSPGIPVVGHEVF